MIAISVHANAYWPTYLNLFHRGSFFIPRMAAWPRRHKVRCLLSFSPDISDPFKRQNQEHVEDTTLYS